jgi:hypothetical protein
MWPERKEMNIFDLVFMACLSLGQPSTCKDELLKCVLEKRDSDLKSFIASDVKKLTPDQFLSSQPQAKWAEWTLDCAQIKTAKEKGVKTPTKP